MRATRVMMCFALYVIAVHLAAALVVLTVVGALQYIIFPLVKTIPGTIITAVVGTGYVAAVTGTLARIWWVVTLTFAPFVYNQANMSTDQPRQCSGLANKFAPFSMCPNCQNGDIETSLLIGSQGQSPVIRATNLAIAAPFKTMLHLITRFWNAIFPQRADAFEYVL